MAGKHEYGGFYRLNRAYAEGPARAFGVGPANPHVSGSPAYTAFAAGEVATAADSTVYSGRTAYAGHTAVTFDGTNDYLKLEGTAPLTGLTTLNAAVFGTIVIKFSATDITPAATKRLFSLYEAGTPATYLSVFVNTSGELVALHSNTLDGSGWGTYTITAAAVLAAATEYVLQLNWNETTVQAYIDGVAVASISQPAAPANALDLTVADRVVIGASGSYLASSFWDGTLSLVWAWFGEAADSANAALAADVTKFYSGGDRDLGVDGTASGAPAPYLFFGGEQASGDWDLGTNQGTGPDFTRVGDIT
jgi:hypothetical protein